MRTVIRMYLTWQRLEIALVALLVPGLIVESSVANGWVYGGGTLTVISFLRGFFFEVVTYVTARQAFVLAGKKQVFGCVLMALTSLAAVYVSAVNNLGWVMAGHDLGGFFGTLGHVMGNGPLVRGYEFFLAVLLPLSVGAIALVPLDHFFQHALEQDHLDNHAVLVDERHMHRTRYLKAQRKQKKRIQQAYEAIAQERANQFIDQARDGISPLGWESLRSHQPNRKHCCLRQTSLRVLGLARRCCLSAIRMGTCWWLLGETCLPSLSLTRPCGISMPSPVRSFCSTGEGLQQW